MTTMNAEGRFYLDLPRLVAGDWRPAAGIGAGWVPFEYELAGLPLAVGLATGALSPDEALTLDLGLTGWHTLHVCHAPVLRLSLEGERGYEELPGPQAGSDLRDFALPPMDFTGRRLRIAPKRGADTQPAILFYLRAVPCAGPRAPNRRLVATEDGHGVFWGGLESLDELYKYLYPYRQSDFFRILWGVFGGGDVTTDPQAARGTLLPTDPAHYFNRGEWL